MLDSTLPTPAGFNASNVVSSTPAVVKEDETSLHDTGVVLDGSYITASNGMLNEEHYSIVYVQLECFS